MQLRELAEELAIDGWRDTKGWDGAFLYPKVKVGRTVSKVVEVAEFLVAISSQRDVTIVNIDADTSADVRQSNFVTLYRA